MPIRQFAEDNGVFRPEDLKLINDAFSAALARLGLGRSNPVSETVARKIIRAALAGERNPERLCEIGVDGARSHETRAGG